MRIKNHPEKINTTLCSIEEITSGLSPLELLNFYHQLAIKIEDIEVSIIEILNKGNIKNG